MTSTAAKQAFEIDREHRHCEAYGMTSLDSAVLGAATVEAGCRFVTIENGHWDTHARILPACAICSSLH